MKSLRYVREMSTECMFVAFIYGLSTFAKRDLKEDRSNRGQGAGEDLTASNDSALFELGCYMYFRIDMWLFMTHPELRKRVSEDFLCRFVDLFTQALDIPNVADLVDQRMKKYGELARSGAEIGEYHLYLTQLILRTEDNQKPRPYDFDNEPLIVSADQFRVKFEIVSWDAVGTPGLIQDIEREIGLLR